MEPQLSSKTRPSESSQVFNNLAAHQSDEDQNLDKSLAALDL